MNKRKKIEYLEIRISELEAEEMYYNKHDDNDIISRAITGLMNIKKIIELRLEGERNI